VNYLGVPEEQVPNGSVQTDKVSLVGMAFRTVDRRGYRTFVFRPGSRSEQGNLVVVLSDDFMTFDQLNSDRREGIDPPFSYHARPSIPRWLLPYGRQ
jgi:hypothetical protein